ncbi:hypothetical protein AB0G04_42610 [Actinoplanes sp. NPDC023801]|uniref:hypothetical protein n=1 Tax=Actinoplanes sp. NPDC023801 TaxID=3154595 RepID=UPI0033F058C9
MRRTMAILGAFLGMALLSGYGTAARAESAATSTAAGSSTVIPAAAGSGTMTSGAASTPKKGKKLVLGPNGLGALKLGMTRRQAEKTKLVKKRAVEVRNNVCNADYRIRTAKTDAPVFLSRKLGIASITAYPGVATPQGIKLGSPAKAVKKAYPGWRSVTDTGLKGRGLVKVPGNRKAYYNITISRGKVTSLQLELRNQNCYE